MSSPHRLNERRNDDILELRTGQLCHREPEGRGSTDSWEMIPLCKGQMEMTLGQPPDRSSLGLFLVRRDDDREGWNNETILIKEVPFLE